MSFQEEWDNSGLQVGDPRADIRAALLTTDVTESVVSEAIAKQCDLIISHHPLLFHGLKAVCGRTPQERCVAEAIRHGIAIYSSHTAIDCYPQGVSGRILEVLGISSYRVLVPSAASTPDRPHGLGAIGNLDESEDYYRFLERIKQRFGAAYLRYTRPVTDRVRTIATCGGAGAEFLEDAIRQGADLYLTADTKYHEMQAADGRIALVDIDHWTSEHFTRDIFQELLRGHVTTYISEADATPVHCL